MHIDKKKTQIAILAVLGCALIGSAAFQFFPQQKTAPQRPVKKIAPETAPAPERTSSRSSGKAEGVAVPPITELDPRTVYSGNLGTLTGIQAGADLKKMELEFAQLDAKIRELQKKEDGSGRSRCASLSFPAFRCPRAAGKEGVDQDRRHGCARHQ